MSGKVRIAVVGGGHLGTYHCQKIVADERAQLVAVIDPVDEKRQKLASLHHVSAFATLAELRDPVDAVIVATPTRTHSAIAHEALERNLHVLVEKPITATTSEAVALVEAAKKRGRVLQVGHTERWNPAVTAALAMVDKPGYIVAERLAPFSGRSTDVDVVLDLMIHDLDIVGALISAKLVETRSVGVPIITSEIDMAAARLQFEDGTVAQISAGRASLEPVRKIRLFTKERYVSIDCAAREVKSVRRLPPEPGSTWPQISGEPVEVPPGDALQLQDRDFIRCILENGRPRVDGPAGLRALELAEAVKQALTAPLA
ncbi:MAG: Gfo/Idh/MocA family protein [Myxococcota bacterium]|nr:Gfo/Idh/MocA family oxidoreductase [Myxococcota bacterium]